MTGFSALPVVEDEGDDAGVQWAGVSRILGPRWAQLPALTVGLLGLQVMWSIEFSYASPYLIQLGLSKSLMAIVFLAGPLSGLIVQPLIGVIADNSKSRFGRRRPYMIFGSAICVFSMLLLGFTRQFASIFTRNGSQTNDALTIALAIWAIYCIDFSINAVQAVDRALLVDTLPTNRQATGNAWAARMLGIGSVVGFFVGNIDMTKVFPIFGNTQLEVLSVVASFLLISTHGMTGTCVKEKVLVSSSRSNKGFRKEVKDIWHNLLTLPRIIRQICIIQFFAWIAWFPVLFYTTLYIGELHKRASPEPQDADAATALNDEATRLGSRAQFYSALLALSANIIMPLFISKPSKDLQQPLPGAGARKGWAFARVQIHLCELWMFSHLLFAFCMGATFFTSSVAGATILVTLTGFSWAITQWAPFSLLGEEILSDPSSTADDGGSIRLTDTRTTRRSTEPTLGDNRWDNADEHFRLVGDGADEDDEEEEEEDGTVSSRAASLDGDRPNPLMGNGAARRSRVEMHSQNGHVHFDTDEFPNGASEGGAPLQQIHPGSLQAKAGIILGIHNLFLVVPQFLVTGLASVIFAIFDPAKSVLHGQHPGKTPPSNAGVPVDTAGNGTSSALLYGRALGEEAGPNSVAIIFRVGGVTAIIACVLSWRLAKELKRR